MIYFAKYGNAIYEETCIFEADSKENAQKYEDAMVNKLLVIIKEISTK